MSGAILSERSGISDPATITLFGPFGLSGTVPFISWEPILECLGQTGHWSILRDGADVKVFAPPAFSGEPSCWGRS